MSKMKEEIMDELSLNVESVKKFIEINRTEINADRFYKFDSSLQSLVNFTKRFVNYTEHLSVIGFGNYKKKREDAKINVDILIENVNDVYQELKVICPNKNENNSISVYAYDEIEDSISNAFLNIKDMMDCLKKDVNEMIETPDKSRSAFERSSKDIKEVLEFATQCYQDVADRADKIRLRITMNRLDGPRANQAASQAIFNHDINPPESDSFMGKYLIRSSETVIIETIPDQKLVFATLPKMNSTKDVDEQNEIFKGKTVIYANRSIILFEQPEVDEVIKASLEKSQIAILKHMDSWTPIGEGGLSVVLQSNAGKIVPANQEKPWQRQVIAKHYPENSVLKGHPQTPFCYQLYRNIENPQQVVLAAVLDKSSEARKVHIIAKSTEQEKVDYFQEIDDFELLPAELCEKEWVHFGYHLPSSDEDDTVFAGSIPEPENTENAQDPLDRMDF